MPSFSFSSLLLSSLELSDTTVYEPEIRARLGTAAHFCEVVALPPAPTLVARCDADLKRPPLSEWPFNHVQILALGFD